MAREITLSRGLIALVDDVDYERVAAKRWSVVRARQIAEVYYARHAFWVDGKSQSILLHRFILDAPAGQPVDHVNGDRLDCRRANLRFCTLSQNAANRAPRPNAFKGVNRRSSRWEAHIKVDGVDFYLGTHDAPEDAARAYDRAAIERFGQFARVNFPDVAA